MDKPVHSAPPFRAQTHTQQAEPSAHGQGFDVTIKQIIGRVEFGPDGDEQPHVAAFKLIALNDEPGEYEFPGPFLDSVVRVKVDFVGPGWDAPHTLRADTRG